MDISASNSDHSSPEDFGADDDPNPSLPPSADGQTPSASTVTPSLANGADSPSSLSQKPAKAPIQKRRRVTRACDECRRKKIKCDGKQPCTHCTVYSYDCTYDQPSNRRRNPTPQYIEALENRLQRAETLLRTLLPNVDLNDPNVEAVALQQAQANAAQHVGGVVLGRPDQSPGDAKLPLNSSLDQQHDPAAADDAKLHTMIENTGQLDLDENNNWDFHGSSSGTVFMRRMREQFGGLLGDGKRPYFLPRPPRHPSISQITYDTPRSGSASVESPVDSGLPNVVDLPSKDIAITLCENALTCACALLRFIHKPTFFAMLDKIYETTPENMGSEEHRFLPLLYSVLAVGSVFGEPVVKIEDPDQAVYKTAIESGLKYFQSARAMIEITDCRDLMSLHAVVFMIIFLQSSANLSVCYSFVGIALRSAIRLGLHRNLAANFNPIEQETRRRTFWVVRKMDIYVSAMLGFPQMLRDEDIDQDNPMEVEDEYLTTTGVLPVPPGRISMIAAGNAHTQLMTILSKVIRHIYPTKDQEHSVTGEKSYYTVKHTTIREIESDLQNWLDNLPVHLRPFEGAPTDVVRVQHLLRMSYAHVQMMLYRPFLHYVSPSSCIGKTVDQRSYACAAAGISVSRNIVHIVAEMKKRKLLTGAYWFTMYTTFFAIISLVYFILENPDALGSDEIYKDANIGKDTLKDLAKKSLAADRCSVVLGSLFEQLPERLRRIHDPLAAKHKKRPAPEPKLKALVNRSQTFIDEPQQRPNSASATIKPFQRAKTFPSRLSTPGQLPNSVTFDGGAMAFEAGESPLRQTYQDLASPGDVSASQTPDSTPNSFQPSSMMITDPFPGGDMFPDLGAMMFPTGDPFAYPNQPLMEFDNHQQRNQPLGTTGAEATSTMLTNSSPDVFLSNDSNGSVAPRFTDIEGQFFGPFPPYLTQNMANTEGTGQLTTDTAITNTNAGSLHAQAPSFAYHGMGTQNTAANFDDIFTGGSEEWAGMFTQ